MKKATIISFFIFTIIITNCDLFDKIGKDSNNNSSNNEKTWFQDAYLKASNSDAGDYFGITVAMNGDTIVSCARFEDSNQTIITNTDASASSNNSVSNSGALYVFKKDVSGNWVQDAYLKPSNPSIDDYFGDSVAIYGNTIVVGAPLEDSTQTTITNTDSTADLNNNSANSGAVYVFKKDDSGNWIQDAYLKASNGDSYDLFGYPVGIYEDTIVVGARYEYSNQTFITNTDGIATSDNSSPESGAVFVFKKDGSGNWIQDAYLKASNTDSGDFFGQSIAISGDTIVVGARCEDSSQTSITNTDGSASIDNSLTNGGAVYVFKKDGSENWIQDAYIKTSNVGENDYFGDSIAISGNTLVVGSGYEDSNQTFITNADNLSSIDNSAIDSGAVYVYKRDLSGNWVQDAYLKAANIDSDDRFSYSVATNGDTIVVGAPLEDSSQTIITNTDGLASLENSLADSGAVYVFKKDGSGNWIQDAYLKSSNSNTVYKFGVSVTLSGDNIVVGCPLDDSNQSIITNTDGSSSSDNSATDSGAVYIFKKI